MLRRVLEHNRLNGYAFVTAEFGIVSAAVFVFAVLYGMQGRWFYAAIAAGITANALLVFGTALASLLRHQPSIGVRRLYINPAVMAEVQQSNPRLLRDTMLIVVTVLIPFSLLLLAGPALLPGRH